MCQYFKSLTLGWMKLYFGRNCLHYFALKAAVFEWDLKIPFKGALGWTHFPPRWTISVNENLTSSNENYCKCLTTGLDRRCFVESTMGTSIWEKCLIMPIIIDWWLNVSVHRGRGDKVKSKVGKEKHDSNPYWRLTWAIVTTGTSEVNVWVFANVWATPESCGLKMTCICLQE